MTFDRDYNKDNKTFIGHLLNHMTNVLVVLIVPYKYAKEVWDILEKKYGVDDANKRKFVVGNWLQFQFVDEKPIVEHVLI